MYFKYCRNLTLAIAIIACSWSNAQEDNSAFKNGKEYTIGEITVSGSTAFNAQTIISFSGIQKGKRYLIPGEEIGEAIKKLYGTKLFSDIDIYITDIEGDVADINIALSDLPELNLVTIKGIKAKRAKKLKEETKLIKGVKVTENLIITSKNFIENKYKKEGFVNTKVTINTEEVVDSIQKERVNLIVDINKGKKVKVKDIIINGNEVLSDKKLRKAMKNTKKKSFFNFFKFKRSKYIEEKFEEDLVSLVNKYKENGYRDARVLSDSLIINNDETVSLEIDVEEGKLYHFGKIDFIGNTAYTDRQLRQVLQIEEGDIYNGVQLEKRIVDNTKPDGVNLTNLYQNNGYLFSTINPVEVNAEGQIIDMEIRISEGKPAYFNEVSIKGNEKTNDHVVYRELRTRPGELYSKANIIRTIRELGQLGFFDAQQIEPELINPNPNEGTIDLEYGLVESGSSQIELQGGYGGGGFIGTLGLRFNNFSIKNIFKGEAYAPVPTGDGQSLALRLQASRFYRTFSFSFVEPWLNGKNPYQLSTSISHTNQFLYDPVRNKVDKNRRFTITGLSVGIARRLKAPDNFFTLDQSVGFQHYNLENYNTGLFTFGNGYSNNLSYTIGLRRNNTFNDPIYPEGGSSFSVSLRASLPYSLFNSVDYESLENERNELVADLAENQNNVEARNRISEIDQERFKWLEFYKIKFKGEWYTEIVKKLVLRPSVEFGFLGSYNQARGIIPFERFFLGGDGLGGYSLDGREAISLRGYPNQSLSDQDGGTIYNKFSLELRYPITLKSSAKIFGLAFIEGGNSHDGFKDFDPFDLKRSAGFGLRIFMPAFGLLGIDFGYGYDNVPGRVGPNGWETHFIIGQQF